MSMFKKISLVATTLTILGTVEIAPVRALSIQFSTVKNGIIGGTLWIDNSLIQSGTMASDVSSDKIQFSFYDRDFLTSRIISSDSLSVTFFNDLGTSGYFSFTIRSGDVWEDEPWGVRFPDTLYAGNIVWGVPNNGSSSIIWQNRPFRLTSTTYYSTKYPDLFPPPDRLSQTPGLGIWYTDPIESDLSFDISVYASDFLTPDPEPPTSDQEPLASVPEPSSIWGLLLLIGSWLVGYKSLKSRNCA